MLDKKTNLYLDAYFDKSSTRQITLLAQP